jgi:peptidoglycan/xylan/chitin deacetylase (PgdA/CDA1 family)
MKFWPKKRYIKYLTAHLIYITGLLSLWAKIKLRNKAVILMYHRVLSRNEMLENYSQDGIVVKRETFEKHMKYIKNNFKILSLSEFVEHFQKRIPFETKSCLITFDDGWKDNFQNAYPILRENGITSIIFLTTDFIGSYKQFWQERLAKLLYSLYDRTLRDKRFLEKAQKKFQNKEDLEIFIGNDGKDLEDKISVFIAFQKRKESSKIEEEIDFLRQLLEMAVEESPNGQRFLNWDEIGIMAEDGIAFGSHGKSHNILLQAERAEILKEILESKVLIENKLGKGVISFSYPNGDFTEDVVAMVKNNGYKVAFGTGNGFVSIDDDPFKLRRINIHEDMTRTIPLFLARIVGLW